MREVMKWEYKAKDGNVVGHVSRLEEIDKQDVSKSRKSVIPYFKENGQSGIPDDLPPEHRLYGLDSIKDLKETVFIVEGEKCAYALHGLGYQAVTSLGGTNAYHLADWSSLKDAEHICLCPDHDKSGYEYMHNIYKNLKGFRSIGTFNALRFPLREKADICDFLKAVPELKDWDELESILGHPSRDAILKHFKDYLGTSLGDIPSKWKFVTTPHKHRLIELSDFQTFKLPPREMLLSPWLPEGSINMIFADRGMGKTFFALSCALALAKGDEFLCYTAKLPVPVLYLDGEMQATAIQSRFKMLGGDAPFKGQLHLYTPDCQSNDFIPDLGTKSGRDDINELIEAVNPKVIFLDNLSTFDRTGNENEAESWAPIQEWAIQHRKQGRSIVFIHHANKEGKQRGSHKKEDVMDAVIKLKRPDDYVQGEGAPKILVQYTKARHLSGNDVQDIEVEMHNEDGKMRWTWEQGNIAYQKAVEMLKNKISLRDIAEELDISKSTIGRWKSKAQNEGLL